MVTEWKRHGFGQVVEKNLLPGGQCMLGASDGSQRGISTGKEITIHLRKDAIIRKDVDRRDANRKDATSLRGSDSENFSYHGTDNDSTTNNKTKLT